MAINARILCTNLVIIGLVWLFDVTSASRIVFPPVPDEFNTPVMTNGFVGGLTEFSVTGNITIQECAPFSAEGMLVIMPIGPCTREHQYELARDAGAVGVIFGDFDPPATNGRRSRIPLSNKPLEIPVVIISLPDFGMTTEILKSAPYVTMEITPGVSIWHETVGITGWFISLNILFGIFYIFLLGLVIYKFTRKIQATGFILNISFVYLIFQGIFCSLMIVRWFDPVLTWGFYSVVIDAFIDTWPATWSFAALVLMAFFWFEVINQFADTKVQAFLSKKMQIPFWILVGVIILLPAINAILLNAFSILDLFVALLGISFATGMIVACFYIIVAVKMLQVLKRSERLNVDKKSRIRGLMRSRVSIIISTIIACIYPPCNFALRYNILYGSMFFGLAVLLEESVLLGVITFIQVWFMPVNGSASSGTTRGTSIRSTKETNTINSVKDATSSTQDV